MKTDNFLNLSRLKQLLINDIRINRKPILIAAALILVYWTLRSFLSLPSLNHYFFVLFVGGFILTSHAFKDLHQTELAYSYLTLPCSNFERFLSKWLLTSVGYALGLLALFYIFVIARMGLNFAIFHNDFTLPDLFNTTFLHSLSNYIVLHSIVFLGAVVFRRYCLLKTALSVGCIFLVFGYITTLVGLKFYAFWEPVMMQNLTYLVHVAYFSFWAVLAPFCWIVTYLRINEAEIN